jgi:predicted kinase
MGRAKLILISGPPGAGKSTLSRSLAVRLDATLLDKDAVDEPFSPEDRGARYTREIEPRVLQALLNLAELNLRPGHVVILDVPWTHILLNSPHWQKKIRALVKRVKTTLSVIECVLPEPILKERMKKRGYVRDRTRLTADGWKKFKKNRSHCGEKSISAFCFRHETESRRLSQTRRQSADERYLINVVKNLAVF